jgi:methionine sulfoxide reductase heme-binding subunit
MTPLLASAGPSAYWYLTRGSGAVTMILLTLTLVLGVVDVRRFSTPRWPRFVVDSLHRTASLLAVVFLAVHVLTTILDSFVSISLADSVIPFNGSYRTLWLGFGALALDLMLAVALTSVLRRAVGHRVWRATHWLAYACWPIALAHSIGTGTDVGSTWMQALGVVCVAAAAAAVAVRVISSWPAREPIAVSSSQRAARVSRSGR